MAGSALRRLMAEYKRMYVKLSLRKKSTVICVYRTYIKSTRRYNSRSNKRRKFF